MVDTEPIRNFIRREFLFDPDAALGADDPLFPDLIDSLAVMEVVAFCEDEYSVEISDDDLSPESFATLASVAALVERSRR